MRLDGGFHLTYCSNIHPGETWAEVRGNLKSYIPAVKELLSVEGPFGIGLRLSGRAAEELESGDNLAEFRSFLDAGESYVFTINGFPYGVFHGAPIKADVYLPDWLDAERLRYTNRLARILAELAPDDLGMPASVSTVPGAFRNRVETPDAARTIGRAMLHHAAFLKNLERGTGKRVTLAIEAEPRCYLETIEDTVRFFEDVLYLPELSQQVSDEVGAELTPDDVRRYIGFCFDACHMAVEFEDPASALDRLAGAGIEIYKFQISSAVRLDFETRDGQALRKLGPFDEGTYLHQVVERAGKRPAVFVRFDDLSDALSAEQTAEPGEAREWRVHFHVPLFLDRMEGLESTQS